MTDTTNETSLPTSVRARPTTQKTRLAVLGMGVLGRSVARGAALRADLELVALADADPALGGQQLDLGDGVLGLPPVTAELPDTGVDVVAVLTSSRVEQVGEVILELVAKGVNVVTAAEELTYPWHSHPEWSRRLDDAARENGVSILSVGANPGLLMDTLLTVLSLATQSAERISAVRTMDVRVHRAARLRRFGIGLTPDEFRREPAGTLHGHIGFRQSIDALGDALGLRFDEIEESPLSIAHVTATPRHGEVVTIPAGTVTAVEQSAIARVNGAVRVELREFFGFIDDGDPVPKGDSWQICGRDHDLYVAADQGVHSFSTTPATVLNMIGPIRRAPSGLRTVGDFAVRELAAKGQAQW